MGIEPGMRRPGELCRCYHDDVRRRRRSQIDHAAIASAFDEVQGTSFRFRGCQRRNQSREVPDADCQAVLAGPGMALVNLPVNPRLNQRVALELSELHFDLMAGVFLPSSDDDRKPYSHVSPPCTPRMVIGVCSTYRPCQPQSCSSGKVSISNGRARRFAI